MELVERLWDIFVKALPLKGEVDGLHYVLSAYDHMTVLVEFPHVPLLPNGNRKKLFVLLDPKLLALRPNVIYDDAYETQMMHSNILEIINLARPSIFEQGHDFVFRGGP